jgi:Cu/Ag efflux protein CusF
MDPPMRERGWTAPGIPSLPVNRLFILTLLAAGCATDPAVETVEVRAVYERTVFDGAAATFDHEAIPGEMDAMRMDFPLAGAALVAGLAPGDKVVLDLQTEPRIEVRAVRPLPDSTRLRLAER